MPPPSLPSPFSAADGGARCDVRVTPRAAADRIRGVAPDQAGVACLQVAVTAVPEDGRANRAVVRLLAKALGVPRSAVEIQRGASDRRKVLLIRGADPAALDRRLAALLKGKGRMNGMGRMKGMGRAAAPAKPRETPS